MRLLLVLAAVASALLAIAACQEDFQDCYGQDLVACSCSNGDPGYAKCGPGGTYAGSACVCDGTTPGIDAGACTRPGGPDASGTFKKDFEPCATADECEGCRCESFQDKLACTRACATDADCPDAGCNQRGVCRHP